MLKVMAQAGNPAAKDHDALLTDVEEIVQTLTAGTRQGFEQTASMDTEFYWTNFGDQIWSEADWESFLNTCSSWV